MNFHAKVSAVVGLSSEGDISIISWIVSKVLTFAVTVTHFLSYARFGLLVDQKFLNMLCLLVLLKIILASGTKGRKKKRHSYSLNF